MASEAAHLLAKHLRSLSSAARADSLSDRELVERFATQRDEDAFAALLRRHGPMVLRICRRVLHDVHDAEDAFQAVFLVLSRKAASLRCAESVGCWLHGVAYRLALKARSRLARQRMHEIGAAVEKYAVDPLAELSVREAQAILDEELARLPEKYRAPLVLCYLEGQTRDEAARQLGWSAKLVKSRLEQGRERLRSRLSHRGLTVPAALVATLLAEEAAPAALPATLLRAAVQAASASPGNGVSAPVALLAESALGSTAIGKAKVAVVGLLLLTGALAAGMGAFAPPPVADAPGSPSRKVAENPKSKEHRQARTDRYGDPLPAGAIARIGTVRWWCGRIRGPLVNTLIYTPDGKSLVFSGDRETVHFLDAATGKELRRIVFPHEGGWPYFALTPNGKTLVTADLGGPAFHVWDVSTGKKLRRIKGDERGIIALAFTPDGKTFAAGMSTDIGLWDTTTWKEIRRIAGKDFGHYGGIFFLADGKTLISGDTGRISWWDTATGQVIRRINSNKYGKKGGFAHLAVSPDGKRLAVVFYGSSNLLLLWDAATGKEVRRIEFDPKFSPSCLCFSPDSRLLACGSGDNGRGYWSHQTRFFSAATGEELRRWDEGDYHANQMAFSRDGKILAQAMSGVIRLRDVKTGKPIVPVLGLPNSCLAVCFSGDGKALVAGCRGGRTGTWDSLTGAPLAPLRDPPEGFGRQHFAPLGTALTAHGERAALLNAKDTLYVWEPTTGKVCCRITEPPAEMDQVDFSPDGKMVTLKHQDNIFRLWDARTGKLLRAFPRIGLVRTPHPRAFSPDGRILAIGPAHPDNGVIHLYETATGKEEGRFTWRDSTDVNCLLFTPDGKYLLAAHRRRSKMEGGPTERGDEEDALRLWDRDSGREARRIRMPVHWDQAIALSPDGKTVAASVGDTIILWELASGAERGRFRGHREWIRSLAFSPDGRLLASGSLDHTACVWDVTGICPDGQWSIRQVQRDELQGLWTELGNKDGGRAYRAMWRLAAAGPSAAAFLAQRLRAVPRVEEDKLTRLIADLDSDRFETRQHASEELQRLGEQAEPALRKALTAKPSLEAARRLRALLDQVERRTLPAEQLHALRAVEVLEHLGTPEARAILQSLSAGAPRAILTGEAKAALGRLRHRSSAAP